MFAIPGLSLRSNPGLGLANAFGVTTQFSELQTTFASKFYYGLWRPVSAIRRADEDNNANTTADPSWSSLITNPPYPSYAGNNAAIVNVAGQSVGRNVANYIFANVMRPRQCVR